MNKIFDQVKKNPQSADDLHRLMNYYLPTTKKLLDAYVELDRQGGGANAIQTKSEISEAMDTINEAFENLLDSMFQDMAWEISSDISVMKTMLAQDGLTQKELAERTGIAQGDISKLEKGNANPSLKTLKRLADGMGMTLKIAFEPQAHA